MYQIGKFIYRRQRQKALTQALQQTEQRLTIEEPILDEFNVITGDRVSSKTMKKCLFL